MIERHFNNNGTPYEWEPAWREAIGALESERDIYVNVDTWEDHPNYLDKGKLSRLPIIFEEMPIVTDPRREVSVVIPIYRGKHMELLHNVFFKSALWVMRSFLKYTDIREQHIGIWFFIEESLRTEISPYLRACALNEDDVCIFYKDTEFSYLKDEQRTWCQKSYLWTHPLLHQFEHIFWLDSDIFVRRRNDGKPLKLFEKLMGWKEMYPNELILLGRFESINTISSAYWKHGFPSEDEFIVTAATAIDIPVENFHLDRHVCNKYGWFPIQYFNKTYPDFKAWIQKWIPVFIADEPALCLYLYKYNIPFCPFDMFVNLVESATELKAGQGDFLDIHCL